jgi:hypothetical protein
VIVRASTRIGSAVDPSVGIVEALVAAVDVALNDTELGALFTSTSAAVTAQLTSHSSEFFTLAAEATLPTMLRIESAGHLQEGIDAEDAIRWLLRIAMSFLTSNPRLDAREQRRLLKTFVTPAIFKETP